MSLEFFINTKELTDALESKSKKFFQFAKLYTSRAGWEFVRFFSLKFLSGRLSDNTGLRRVTSELFKSFKSSTIGGSTVGDLVTKVYFGASGYYVRYHDASYIPEGEPRKNHVRIDVFGNWQTEGAKLYRGAVALSMKEFLE